MVFGLGIGLYLALMMLIGWLASRRIQTMNDYLIAKRRLPFSLAMPTLVATFFGAGSCLGVSGTVYSEGFYGVIADPFGASLALVIAGLFFAAPLRRLRLVTISDLLGVAYGPRFEMAATLLMIPFYIGTLASQMLGMGYVYHIVTGGAPEWGVLLGSAIVVLYTVSGGMWAVTLTDFIQLGLLVLGLSLLIPICLEQTPDHPQLWNSFFHEFSTLTPRADSGWLAYAGRFLMTGLGAMMGQDLIQRALASRSEAVARSSALVAGLVYFLIALIPLFIGIAGRQIFPELENPELLIPLLAKTFLTPLAFTLFACGLLAAIMSTADSYLLAGTSLISNNILLKLKPLETESQKIRLLRQVNLVLALIALVLALSGQSIFNLMVHSGATLFVSIFVPATAALFWKSVNRIAAWTAVFAGLVGWLGFLAFQQSEYLNLHEDLLFAAAMFGGVLSFACFAAVAITQAAVTSILPRWQAFRKGTRFSVRFHR